MSSGCAATTSALAGVQYSITQPPGRPLNSGTSAQPLAQYSPSAAAPCSFMTFARTWTKVPFMRFDRRMVDRGGTAAATASARALALGLGRMGCHGLPMGKEASTLGNASGECATPTEFSTDPGPRRSQLASLASNGTADGPEWALPLMPLLSPPPTLAPGTRQAARGVAYKPCSMAAVAWFGLPGRRLAPPRVSIALLMSGSFVHRYTIAGCRSFARPLPSGPHKEGRHDQ
jgi:hypothetical protein